MPIIEKHWVCLVCGQRIYELDPVIHVYKARKGGESSGRDSVADLVHFRCMSSSPIKNYRLRDLRQKER